MILVLTNGEWVEGLPQDGDRVREIKGGGSYVEYTYVTPVEPVSLVVTSPSSNRAVITQGGSVDLTVEIRQGESVLPINDSFAMPIRRVYGAVERTVMMEFIDGVCSKSIAFNDSGEFEVSHELVNMHLPEDSQFEFDGFYISVVES